MLQLDGAQIPDRKTFRYPLPPPFGPDRSAAFIKVTARPALAQNKDYRAAVDEVLHEARVRDTKAEQAYAKDADLDALIRAREENSKWARETTIATLYDHCVESWETNVVSKGKPLEPTRENFLALAAFEHKALAKVFAKIRDDLTDFDAWSQEAEDAVLEDEAGN